MKLYIYELTIQSSYKGNTEQPANENYFDTVQWWICEDKSWRIRTFDIDSDIHIHCIGQPLTIEQIDGFMKKQYFDVLVGRYDFPEITFESNSLVIEKMKSGILEVDKDKKFAFWNHDERKYSTKTNPNKS